MIAFQERIRGLVYGAALGDALGAPVEKLSYEEIKKRYGRVESLKTEWYKTDPELTLGKRRGNGIVTDDTLMIKALIQLYMKEKRHLDAYDMGNGFVKEIAYEKTYIPEFGRDGFIIDRLFYPEKYIFIRHVLANCEPREGGIGNMINCGAAMYIAPIGAVNAGNPKGAYDEAILFAMGHQSSYGLEAAGVLAACVAKGFEADCTIDDIVTAAVTFAKDGTKQAILRLTSEARDLKERNADMDEIISVLHSAMAEFSPMGDDVHRKFEKIGIPSSHYTPSRLFSIEELPMALAFIVLNEGDFYKSVFDGINSGRDTDSIGVMAGVILGAMQGDGIIKAEDKELLKTANRIDFDGLAEQFAGTAEEIIREDLALARQRITLI